MGHYVIVGSCARCNLLESQRISAPAIGLHAHCTPHPKSGAGGRSLPDNHGDHPPRVNWGMGRGEVWHGRLISSGGVHGPGDPDGRENTF